MLRHRMLSVIPKALEAATSSRFLPPFLARVFEEYARGALPQADAQGSPLWVELGHRVSDSPALPWD
jgi:hypothetical protein